MHDVIVIGGKISAKNTLAKGSAFTVKSKENSYEKTVP